MRLDAHQHFWQYNPVEHVWMEEEHNVLKRDFMPPDVEPLLQSVHFDGLIAVQAREMVKETVWLLSLADQYAFICGVVGWVDLCDPNVEKDLERFAAHPRLRGMRMVIHDRPDVDFAISPDHQRGVGMLAAHGLTYDLLLKPQHIRPATQLVDRFPNQKFVVDHIAKPDIKNDLFSPWREDLTELAQRPNVYCKLSGMVTEADWKEWKPTDLHPYLDIVASAFGPSRLMIGADWPVCTCVGTYQEVLGATLDWSAQFSPAEQAGIAGENCARFYGIK